MIDLWNTRRDTFLECEYWSQRDIESDAFFRSKLIYNQIPTGTFKAKEVNSYQREVQVIGETFLTESNNVTIMTNDDVSEMKSNDYVRFNGDVYRVEDVQKQPIKKQQNYIGKDYSCSYYISLRR